MRSIRVDGDFEMYYREDCFCDPWTDPEPVLMVHGIAESSLAWYRWIPELAGEFRVLRPDLRGFGHSEYHFPDEGCSLEQYADDLRTFLKRLDLEDVHIISAKMGGTVSYQLASEYPKTVKSLTVVSSPVHRPEPSGVPDQIRELGVRGWVEETMESRLGSTADPDMFDWWVDYMSGANKESCLVATEILNMFDIRSRLSDISAPSLILTTQGSDLASVETVEEWTYRIPNGTYSVLQGDAYHPAAVTPMRCIAEVLPFLRSHGING